MNVDNEAIKLDANDCEFSIENDDIKKLEFDYFANLEVEAQLLFGGTLGKANGGITAFAVSANGKLLAQAINNGSILVYETEFFQLIRIYEGDSQTQYVHLEFSSDNCS